MKKEVAEFVSQCLICYHIKAEQSLSESGSCESRKERRVAFSRHLSEKKTNAILLRRVHERNMGYGYMIKRM